ncbi:hypothetical protein LPB86_02130 [Pedobacter sp. MC2016-14]|uniref:hypothetical protein n=1 Tax=Pedobacter sp. MC2016-14 TaxID=2897327 RepID=UPI001E46CE74|nr:hypothetical protein [Pedobacter sp. MC2016-14]MCD0487009.1 hypothetical protein [Pedobacter sp. MC2016-14]
MVNQVTNISTEDPVLLKSLIERYPYHQPLHLMLAKATMGMEEAQTALATAALYTNGQLLHNIVFDKTKHSDKEFNIIAYPEAAPAEKKPAEDIFEVEDEIKDTIPEQALLSPETDEQEVFDEIGELYLYHTEESLTSVETENTVEEVAQEMPVPTEAEDLRIAAEEEELVLENIVSSDFFAFEQKLDTEISEPIIEDKEDVVDDAPVQAAEENRVSNYHDDKLPYTFLWWLAKTRKEYQSFQPYVTVKKQPSHDLQQQYVEHIFHIQSPFNPEEILNNSAQLPHADPKEVELIDTFIKNAPQIGTLKTEQIDNENKARKSAEDHNDVVSETLAKIYIEQMLYHKALETYEKLSLKFPEKSRYFADLIQSIKKKI